VRPLKKVVDVKEVVVDKGADSEDSMNYETT